MYEIHSVLPKIKSSYVLRLDFAVKRAFDIVFSVIALIFLTPAFGLIALAIQRDSPGPVFYRGKRLGKNGKDFSILKFRTMYEKPESYQGPRVTAQDDPRITRLGHWLRQTKLNELPQFWNVLKGEMSLVGPRPEDPILAKTWPRGAWQEILSVKPGITSPASILYHDEESRLNSKDVLLRYLEDLTPDKLRLDQLYIRNRSFWLDLDVILWTVLIMLPRISAFSPPEQLLFVGPITRLFQRFLNWVGVDTLVTLIAIGLTGALWRVAGPLNIGLLRAVLYAVAFSLLFSLVSSIWGSSRIQWNKALDTDMLVLLPPWLISTGAALFLNLRFGTLPTGLILVAALLALSGFIFVRFHQRLLGGLTRYLVSLIERTHTARERVLIVGSGRTAEHISWVLTHPCYARRFKILGFVDDDLFSYGMRIYGSNVIGALRDTPALLKRFDVGLIILADHRLSYQEFVRQTGIQDSRLVRVTIAPDLFGSMSFLNSDSPILDATNELQPSNAELPCQQCLIRQSATCRKLAEQGTLDNEIEQIVNPSLLGQEFWKEEELTRK